MNIDTYYVFVNRNFNLHLELGIANNLKMNTKFVNGKNGASFHTVPNLLSSPWGLADLPMINWLYKISINSAILSFDL